MTWAECSVCVICLISPVPIPEASCQGITIVPFHRERKWGLKRWSNFVSNSLCPPQPLPFLPRAGWHFLGGKVWLQHPQKDRDLICKAMLGEASVPGLDGSLVDTSTLTIVFLKPIILSVECSRRTYLCTLWYCNPTETTPFPQTHPILPPVSTLRSDSEIVSSRLSFTAHGSKVTGCHFFQWEEKESFYLRKAEEYVRAASSESCRFSGQIHVEMWLTM